MLLDSIFCLCVCVWTVNKLLLDWISYCEIQQDAMPSNFPWGPFLLDLCYQIKFMTWIKSSLGTFKVYCLLLLKLLKWFLTLENIILEIGFRTFVSCGSIYTSEDLLSCWFTVLQICLHQDFPSWNTYLKILKMDKKFC